MTRQRNQSRRMGQDIRAWPVLALLLVAVLGAIGGVLWFMREAIENGRLAARQKVVEAYRGQLQLLQKEVESGWRQSLSRLDAQLPAPAKFARAAREDWADAIINLDPDGHPAYPQGRVEIRDAEANALLLKLEQAAPGSPPFAAAAAALQARVNNYESDSMPSSQRRFLMRELERLVPGAQFPTLASEDLAGRYLEEHPVPEKSEALRATKLRDVWTSASPGGHVIALFSSARLRAELQQLAHAAAPATRAQIIPPGETAESALVSGALGPAMPGWQLALSAEGAGHSDATADRAASIYLWTAGALIAGLAAMGTLVARGLGRQVKLTRLKTDLVAMVSHELKTPLTGMRALVDTLLDAEKLDEKTTREYLGLLARENARLSALIENFLTFSRLERNKFTFRFEPVPPAELVDAAVAAMGERCHAPECQLEMLVAADLPSVKGDRGALTTALLNLLDNAWKYTGVQKRIAVRAEVRNGSVCFAVEDNGIGLGAKERARVFDRFYQADQRLAREVGGCGLGLSIAQAIAEAHEGTVSVASEIGRGSTFTLEIPVHPQ